MKFRDRSIIPLPIASNLTDTPISACAAYIWIRIRAQDYALRSNNNSSAIPFAGKMAEACGTHHDVPWMPSHSADQIHNRQRGAVLRIRHSPFYTVPNHYPGCISGQTGQQPTFVAGINLPLVWKYMASRPAPYGIRTHKIKSFLLREMIPDN